MVLLGFTYVVPARAETSPSPSVPPVPAEEGDPATPRSSPSETDTSTTSRAPTCEGLSTQSDVDAYCVLLSDTAPAGFLNTVNSTQTDPSPDVPSACANSTDGFIALSRTYACGHQVKHALLIRLLTMTPIAYTKIHTIQVLDLNSRGLNQRMYEEVWFSNTWGPDFLDPVELTLIRCALCTASNAPSTYNSQTQKWSAEGVMHVNPITPGTSITGGSDWTVTLHYSGPGIILNDPVSYKDGGVVYRCDNVNLGLHNPNPGCVFGGIKATVTYPTSTMPTIASHIDQAMTTGLPGRTGSGTYLTRLTDSSLISKNRTTACPASLPRPSGKTCDEYPFASTYQGAFTNGSAVPRSFPGCGFQWPPRTGGTGYSVCFVPDVEQHRQGGLMSVFYAQNRYLDGDPFQIGFS